MEGYEREAAIIDCIKKNGTDEWVYIQEDASNERLVFLNEAPKQYRRTFH